MNKLLAMIFVMALSSCVDSASESDPKAAGKNPQTQQAGAAPSKILGDEKEDCDEKAKKPIEIKAETISLSGNTGCSLDEMKTP